MSDIDNVQRSTIGIFLFAITPCIVMTSLSTCGQSLHTLSRLSPLCTYKPSGSKRATILTLIKIIVSTPSHTLANSCCERHGLVSFSGTTTLPKSSTFSYLLQYASSQSLQSSHSVPSFYPVIKSVLIETQKTISPTVIDITSSGPSELLDVLEESILSGKSRVFKVRRKPCPQSLQNLTGTS